MKMRLATLERRLGVKQGLFHLWVQRGHLPYRRGADGLYDFTEDDISNLFCLVAFWKARKGQRVAYHLMGYDVALMNGRVRLYDARRAGHAKAALWTRLERGFPLVDVTLNGKSPGKNAINVSKIDKWLHEELQFNPLEEVLEPAQEKVVLI